MVRKTDSSNHTLESLQKTILLSVEQRRLQRRDFNFEQLVQGRINILSNDECIDDLASLFANEVNGESELKKKILIALGGAVTHDDRHLRERALRVLIQAGEHASRSDRKDMIFLVAQSFVEWLDREDE